MDTAEPCTLSALPETINKHFPPSVPFVRYGTHGDGTCFFHSVCAARNEQNYLNASPSEQKRIGRQYRADFTRHVSDAKWDKFCSDNGFDMSAEQARKNFRNSKHWANQAMIQFVANTMKLNLLFVDTEKSKLYCGVHGGAHEPLIVILWVMHMHFEPAGAVRAVGDSRTGVQFVFDPVQDKDIVDHIMGNYNGQCSV